MEIYAKCVQCGYCCTVRPCPYGEWDVEKQQCSYLTQDKKCSKYEEIIASSGSEFSPAFGAGCSSSLFNSVREAKIKEMEMKKNGFSMVEVLAVMAIMSALVAFVFPVIF